MKTIDEFVDPYRKEWTAGAAAYFFCLKDKDPSEIAKIMEISESEVREILQLLLKKKINQKYGVDAVLNNVQVRQSDEKIDFDKMYREFERKYNIYPVQMSKKEAFRHALKDRLIDEATYQAARKYYGSLWFYVGD